MSQESQCSSCQSSVPPEILQNQDEDFIQLLYFNDYECQESEVDSDVENFESDNEVDYVEHFVEPSVDEWVQRILW